MNKTEKQRTYDFNVDRLPKEIIGAEVSKAFQVYVLALDIAITETRYKQLPDWMKTYWKLRE